MFKKKLIVASFLVLSLGLTACNDGEINNPPPAEENQNNDKVQDNKVDDNQDIKDKGTQNDEIDNEVDQDDEIIEEDLSGAENLGSYGNISITVKEAYNIFITEKPNTDLQKVELDYDNDVYYYKIEGHDGDKYHEMKIDAHTGEITKLESENDDKEETLDVKYLEKIDELVRKSIDDSGEGFISMEWDLDEDNGVAELEVEIEREGGEVEYTYNLETGELLEKDS